MGQETQTEQKKRIHPPRREKTGAEAPPLWLDLLHALVWSVVLVALCFTFFVRIICVEGISMEPALRQNDRVLVLSTLWHAPQNGDIVVFRKDSFLSEAVIKRIIATEGQTVDIDFNTRCGDGRRHSVGGTVYQGTYPDCWRHNVSVHGIARLCVCAGG